MTQNSIETFQQVSKPSTNVVYWIKHTIIFTNLQWLLTVREKLSWDISLPSECVLALFRAKPLRLPLGRVWATSICFQFYSEEMCVSVRLFHSIWIDTCWFNKAYLWAQFVIILIKRVYLRLNRYFIVITWLESHLLHKMSIILWRNAYDLRIRRITSIFTYTKFTFWTIFRCSNYNLHGYPFVTNND